MTSLTKPIFLYTQSSHSSRLTTLISLFSHDHVKNLRPEMADDNYIRKWSNQTTPKCFE
jgi:hypothetical protein